MKVFSPEQHDPIPLIDFSASPFYSVEDKSLHVEEEGFVQKVSYLAAKALLFIQAHNPFYKDKQKVIDLSRLIEAEKELEKYELIRLEGTNQMIPDNRLMNIKNTFFESICSLAELSPVKERAKDAINALSISSNLKLWRWQHERDIEANTDLARTIRGVFNYSIISSEPFIQAFKEELTDPEKEFNVQNFNENLRLLRQKIRSYSSLSNCWHFLFQPSELKTESQQTINYALGFFEHAKQQTEKARATKNKFFQSTLSDWGIEE